MSEHSKYYHDEDRNRPLPGAGSSEITALTEANKLLAAQVAVPVVGSVADDEQYFALVQNVAQRYASFMEGVNVQGFLAATDALNTYVDHLIDSRAAKVSARAADAPSDLRKALVKLRDLHISTLRTPTHFNAYLEIIDDALSGCAADAPSEPSDPETDQLVGAMYALRCIANGEAIDPIGCAKLALKVINSIHSRAADALDSQPTGQCRKDGRCQYAIDHGAEGLGHCPAGKCCMPGSKPAECGACHGSGRMVRDADIGTDQECFSCDGSGVSDEASSQPTDGEVRNG